MFQPQCEPVSQILPEGGLTRLIDLVENLVDSLEEYGDPEKNLAEAKNYLAKLINARL